jgi:hypothetical protein
MALRAVKIAVALVLLFALAALIAVIFLARDNRSLRSEIHSLRTAPPPPPANPEPQTIIRPPGPAPIQSPADRETQLELMRLRSEVTTLRQLSNQHADSLTTSYVLDKQDRFAAPLNKERWKNVGNATPHQAARTLFWYLNEAWNGADPKALDSSVPYLITYHTTENLDDYPNLPKDLFMLVWDHAHQVSSISIGSGAESGSNESRGDMVLSVRSKTPDGSMYEQAINFTPIYTASRTRHPIAWSARIYVRVQAGFLRAAFHPIVDQGPARVYFNDLKSEPPPLKTQ